MLTLLAKKQIRATAACAVLACLGAAAGAPAMEARVRERAAHHESEALKKGWKKKLLKVGARERKLMCKAPKGAWKHGVIITLHGGGGSHSDYASNIPLGAPMVEFGDLALEKGFAVISPDSTYNGATDGKGLKCGKRWDCVAVEGRENIDLPFIRKIIDEVIPKLRPKGSGKGVFLTGISNGGFTTILAATTYPQKITAFAPVSCGDPYGTHMDMDTHPRLERPHAPGVFRDNGTGKLIPVVGAAGQAPYAKEKKWPKHKLKKLPAFKQFQDRNDGIVDFSLAIKAKKMLVKHGYRDAGAFVLNGRRRTIWYHFWQRGYNKPLVEFFVDEAEKLRPKTDDRRLKALPQRAGN